MRTTSPRTGVVHPIPLGTRVLLVPVDDQPREIARILSADYHASWLLSGASADTAWSYVGEVEPEDGDEYDEYDDGLREFTGDQVEGFFA